MIDCPIESVPIQRNTATNQTISLQTAIDLYSINISFNIKISRKYEINISEEALSNGSGLTG